MKQVKSVKQVTNTNPSASEAMTSLSEAQQEKLNDLLDMLIEQLYEDEEARALMVACMGVYGSRVAIRQAQNPGNEGTPAYGTAEYLRSMLREVFALMSTSAV